MSDSLLRIEGLSLERGGRLLIEGFDLSLNAGDMVHVEGPNGSGKTTLLRYVAGLSRYGGHYTETGGISRNYDSLLYIGHKPSVKPLLTPRENLVWWCRGQGWDVNGIDQALAVIGLTGFEDIPCHSLSAGQQRRVSLARLYLGKPQLCLLDEPFTSIDKEGVSQLAEYLGAYAEEGGCLMLTSHQPIPTSGVVKRVQL